MEQNTQNQELTEERVREIVREEMRQIEKEQAKKREPLMRQIQANEDHLREEGSKSK